MKHPERAEDCLEHVAQAIQRATEYTERLGSVSAFRQSQRDQDAVIRNIEIIGEAASRIQRHAPEFMTAHPELPWIEMRGVRNRVIHDYFNVDVNVVWSTIKDNLPRLKQQIDDLLNAQRGGPHREPEPDRSRRKPLSERTAGATVESQTHSFLIKPPLHNSRFSDFPEDMKVTIS